jgi:Fe-S-cluster-containing dehydrogenase component
MLFDLNKCSGCYNCFMACKDEHCGHDHLPIAAAQPEMGHYWMNLVERERGQYPHVKVASIPLTCLHCGAGKEEAPCIAAARDGAVYRRPDGIVIIDPVKARGQRQIVESCPYGVIYWNDAAQLPQKCTLCAHLKDAGWAEPRCVEVCPTAAITYGDLDDPSSAIAQLAARGEVEVYPAKKTEAHSGYLNLPRTFIAGTVRYSDVDECAAGAAVTLAGNGMKLATTTNAFGDFEFEGLDAGDYELTISQPGYKPCTQSIALKTDTFIGKLVLQR